MSTHLVLPSLAPQSLPVPRRRDKPLRLIRKPWAPCTCQAKGRTMAQWL